MTLKKIKKQNYETTYTFRIEQKDLDAIKRILTSSNKYSSVSHFIRVAIENEIGNEVKK